VRLLRLASFVICAIVIASFAVFAVDQTKSASHHQQEEINTGVTTPGEPGPKASHEGGLHKAIDDASSRLTSPFSGVLSGSSEWATRAAKLLLALLVYGFGLGYLARLITVRV
jgi:predicted PurR-regulated permease PerM